MAATFMTSNVVFSGFSKSLPAAPSLFLSSSYKPSRLVFTNTSNHSHGIQIRNATQGSVGEGIDEANKRAQEIKDKVIDHAQDTLEDAKDAVGKVADKNKEGTNKVVDTTKEGANRVAETAYEAKDKIEEAAASATEKTAETVKNVGEKAKEAVEGAWDNATDTTQRIKKTVDGKVDEIK